MYIWIVANAFPSVKYPMSGIFEYDQARALANKGVKVIMLCTDIRSIRRKRKLGWDHFTKGNVEVYTLALPVGALTYIVRNVATSFAFKKLAARVIKEKGVPDLIHIHFGEEAAACARHCRDLGIPFVVTEHSSGFNVDVWTKEKKRMADNAYKYADRIISVSGILQKRIASNSNFQSTVIPNIVDTNAFCVTSSDKKEKFVFVSTGTLNHGKGFDILISAFSKLEPSLDTELIIVGDGAERKQLEKQVSLLGVNHKVKFTGQLNRSQIASIYSRADAFVLASRGETFGVVYIEAMAAGLPVIATACGGPEDFVTEGIGVIIPVNDADTLLKAMQELMKNRQSFDSQYISKYAVERFSPQIIAEKLKSVYYDILRDDQ